jgi:hypothetical protein
MSEIYNPEKPSSKAIHFFNQGKTLILGGFYDGNVYLIPLEKKYSPVHSIPFIDQNPVTVIAFDQNEEFCFFGNDIGNIRVMIMDKDPNKWKYGRLITDQLSAISHIHCNSELNLWVSASIDGYINLYTLPSSKLLRCIKVPTSYCDYVFLSSSPLPIIIAITEEEKEGKQFSEIFVYSINGKKLNNDKESTILTCPIIIKDLNSNEYLTYILNETIIIRSLPSLAKVHIINNSSNIYSIFPSEDFKLLYGINKTGDKIYVIRDQ